MSYTDGAREGGIASTRVKDGAAMKYRFLWLKKVVDKLSAPEELVVERKRQGGKSRQIPTDE